jgi:hypothetical protein
MDFHCHVDVNDFSFKFLNNFPCHKVSHAVSQIVRLSKDKPKLSIQCLILILEDKTTNAEALSQLLFVYIHSVYHLSILLCTL